MSTDNPALSTPSSPASFSSLPVELKRNIAEHAAAADDVFYQRAKSKWHTLGDAGHEGHLLQGDTSSSWVGAADRVGRSVKALRAVSKEMKQICDPDLNARDCSTTFFGLHLLFRYGDHFESLAINDYLDDRSYARTCSQQQTINAISLLALLRNINFLDLTLLDATKELFLSSEYSSVWRSINPRMDRLSIGNADPAFAANFLPYFTSVNYLSLAGDELFQFEDTDPTDSGSLQLAQDRQAVAEYISRLPRLQKVTLSIIEEGRLGLTLGDLWTREWASSPSLRYVGLFAGGVDVDMLAFVAKLAPNLEHIELAFNYIDSQVKDTLASWPTFPRMRTLHIEGGILHATKIVAAFAHSPSHHLDLSLTLYPLSPEDIHQSLQTLLPNGRLHSLLVARQSPLPTLNTLRLRQTSCDNLEYILTPKMSSVLQLLCDRVGASDSRRHHDRSRRRDPFYDTELDQGWTKDEKQAEIELAGEEAQRVLDFGKRAIAKATKEGDRAALGKMIEDLRSMKVGYKAELD